MFLLCVEPGVADFELDQTADMTWEAGAAPAASSTGPLPGGRGKVDADCDEDVEWADRQVPPQDPSSGRRSVLEWANKIRSLRREWEHCGRPIREAWRSRTWVVLHFFGGPRRDGDFGFWLATF